MSEIKKFYLLVGLSLLIIFSIILNSLLEGLFLRDIGAYVQRRYYYERVISKKGLSLERARYWREER